MSDFNRAIEKDPKYVEAYLNRGLAYAQGEDQDDQAISDFNKVIELARSTLRLTTIADSFI